MVIPALVLFGEFNLLWPGSVDPRSAALLDRTAHPYHAARKFLGLNACGGEGAFVALEMLR
jgi:hypothetical protein